MDICKLIDEYGMNNLRVFITEEEASRFFKNPFGGRKEYIITNINPHHKIELSLKEANVDLYRPDWAHSMFNQRRFYVTDFNRSSDIDIYVLVDADDKYERLILLEI